MTQNNLTGEWSLPSCVSETRERLRAVRVRRLKECAERMVSLLLRIIALQLGEYDRTAKS